MRAKSYPFRIPNCSYVFHNGEEEPWPRAGIDVSGRTPVLAAGSNQSPEQLARKYSVVAGDVVIPAQRARLVGFDCVYAAKITPYGSIPATFQASPGTRVIVFVLWLTDPQLARMHETEAGYSYDRLAGIRVELETVDEALGVAYAYVARTACLNVAGAPRALAAIAAEDRHFGALSEPATIALVRDRVAPGLDVDDFIRENLADAELRLRRMATLAADALPINFHRQTLATF